MSEISEENIPDAFKVMSVAIENLVPKFFDESKDDLDKFNSNAQTFSIGTTNHLILFEPSREMPLVIRMVNSGTSGTFIQTISIMSANTFEWLDTLQQRISMESRYSRSIPEMSEENIPDAFKTNLVTVENPAPKLSNQSKDDTNKMNSHKETFSIRTIYSPIFFEPAKEVILVIKNVN